MSFYHRDSDSGHVQDNAPVSNGGDDALSFYSFFGDLLVSDAAERAPALGQTASVLTQAARDQRDERAGMVITLSSPGCTPPGQLLDAHVPQVMRLALACPLEDVREAMRALITDLANIDPDTYSKYVQALESAFQPSNFVPLTSCVDTTRKAAGAASADEEAAASSDAATLLEDIFISTGRTSHIDLLMSWHPSYLSLYTESCQFLMNDAGPLPTPWRSYLAIMAAARHQCDYLIALQESEFMLVGGDPAWLKGIAHAPKKLQSLCELNALLAHQPWLITRNHIAALTAGAGADSWSVAELVHALVILSTFHALCGFVGGMGLNHEIDVLDFKSWDPNTAARPKPTIRKNDPAQTPDQAHAAAAASQGATPLQSPAQGSTPASHSPPKGVKPLLSDGEQLLHLLSNSKAHLAVSTGGGYNEIDDTFSEAPLSTRSSGAARPPSSDFLLGEGLSGHTVTSAPTVTSHTVTTLMRPRELDPAAPATKYVLFPTDAPGSPAARLAALKYVNFDVNSKAYSTFFLHDYSWKEHGYALVSRYYQGFAQLIDSEWDTIFSLTYNTVSDSVGVDTTPFRTAIWYYTHRLFGLQHDDFDYNKIPVFLTLALKTFVRKIVCCPESITQADFELKGYKFKPDEKCHIVLLAIEARRQASLLYALHSVMKYMQ